MGLLNTSAVLFIVSIIGTLDPYWTGPNILSLVLGVLVFIGGILFKKWRLSKVDRVKNF